MFNLLICFLLYIKNEQENNKIGFFYDDKGNQHMVIELFESFKSVKNAYLMTKTKSKDETDYVNTADIKKYTRTIRDKNEYKEYKKSKSKSNKKEFNTIFVDMKAVEKDFDKTYTFDFELDNNEKFITRPFHYSEESQKWELGPSESDKKNRTWMYIAGGIVAFCVVGVVVFLSS